MTDMADIRGPARATRNAVPAVRPETVATAPAASEPADEAAAPAQAEPTAAAAAEPSAPARPAPSAAPAPARRGGFFPLLLGGIAAAAIGFALATYVVPEGWPRPAEPDPEIAARLDGLETEFETGLADLGDRIDGLAADLEARVSSAGAETSEAVAALRADLDTLRQDLTALGDTVAALPEGGGAPPELPDFTGAFNEQMSGFQAEIDRVTEAAAAEVEAARAEAEATRRAAEIAARQAELRTALADLDVALDTGRPFAEALAPLSSLSVPPALTDRADDGVTTLAELQRTFPEAARAALAAAPRGPETGAGAVDRFAAFLMAQTNARSLEPRDGDTADAVLSRAEAALRAGELDAALNELAALPEASRTAIGDWLERAEARVAASQAVEALAAEIEAM